MATTYHVAPPTSKPTRRAAYFEEQETRIKLSRSQRSNWSAWLLTVLAISIGAIGGSQISNWRGQIADASELQNLGDILPAVGNHETGYVIEKAGDGKFYADFSIAGQILTMQIDPFAQTSRLVAADRMAVVDKAKSYGDVVVLPTISLAHQHIPNPAFLQASAEMPYSVIGMDLLSQIDGLRISSTTVRIPW